MSDDGWALRYTTVELREAMRAAHGATASVAPDAWTDDDYAACLDTLCHFAKIPGFDDAYSWLAAAHLTAGEQREVLTLAQRVSDQWAQVHRLNGGGGQRWRTWH